MHVWFVYTYIHTYIHTLPVPTQPPTHAHTDTNYVYDDTYDTMIGEQTNVCDGENVDETVRD
jgi:hypothetical protein